MAPVGRGAKTGVSVPLSGPFDGLHVFERVAVRAARGRGSRQVESRAWRLVRGRVLRLPLVEFCGLACADRQPRGPLAFFACVVRLHVVEQLDHP